MRQLNTFLFSLSCIIALYFHNLQVNVGQKMPPKKVQPKAEPKPQPKKEEPKVEDKKAADKNQKITKQQPKKDGKGSIEKLTKDGKGSIQKLTKDAKPNQKQQVKATDKKEEKKDDKKPGDKKQVPKDAKNNQKQTKKDSKVPEKKDAKQVKQITKEGKDAKGQQKKDSKSIAKLEKQEEKSKKDVKEQIVPKDAKGKPTANRHNEEKVVSNPISQSKLERDRSLSKAIINRMEEPEKIQRTKGDDYLIKETGLLEAYQLFLRTICKYGLPTGDIYQFAAQQIEKYERKKKAKQLKLKAQMEIRKAATRKPPKQDMKTSDFQI